MFCSPDQTSLLERSAYTIMVEPSSKGRDQGRENTEVWQLCSSNHNCLTESWVTEPGHIWNLPELTSLNSSKASSGPQGKLQLWVSGYTEGSLQPQELRRFIFQLVTVTGVEIQKPDSWSLAWQSALQKVKQPQTYSNLFQPTQPHPSRLIWVETLGNLRQHNTASGYLGSSGTSQILQRLGTSSPITFSYRSKALGQRPPCHRKDTHLPRE